jgi:peptidoglycan biosynthesis protein MviN/MurJ (putative lipid II flippase)
LMTNADVYWIAKVLAIMSVGLPFYAISQCCLTALNARHAFKTVLFILILVSLASSAISFLLVNVVGFVIQPGVFGFVLFHILSAFGLYYCLSPSKIQLVENVKMMVHTTLTCGCVFITFQFVGDIESMRSSGFDLILLFVSCIVSLALTWRPNLRPLLALKV